MPGPRRSTSRLQPDRVLLRDTNRSFSRAGRRAAGRDRSRLRAAGERTRCRRTYSDSRTGRRSAVDGRQLAVGGSAAWLRGGGLTRRARWKPLDGLTRAPGLLLTPVPWAQPRGGEVTRRTSQGGRAASTTVVGLRARPARRTKVCRHRDDLSTTRRRPTAVAGAKLPLAVVASPEDGSCATERAAGGSFRHPCSGRRSSALPAAA